MSWAGQAGGSPARPWPPYPAEHSFAEERPSLNQMSTTKNHSEPETEPVQPAEMAEEDEEQSLPEPDAPEAVLDEFRRGHGVAGRRPRRHSAFYQARAVAPRRLPHDRWPRRRALCRQGQEYQEARHGLWAADRPRHAYRAHDCRHPHARIRRHAHRNRSAAVGSEPDQAPAAALQRGAARRQIVSLYRDHDRSLGAANSQASRRAHPAGTLLRAVRFGLGRQPHHQCPAARVPAALMQRSVFRVAHAAVPALSDQALLGAVHARDRFQGLFGAGARGQRISVRTQQDGEGRACRRNGEGVRRARFRARRDLPRPTGSAVRHSVAPGRQSAWRRGGGRLCGASAGRLFLRRGVFLPHRAELGQPRLFPKGRPLPRAGRGAVRIPGAVLRRPAAAAPYPDLARD